MLQLAPTTRARSSRSTGRAEANSAASTRPIHSRQRVAAGRSNNFLDSAVATAVVIAVIRGIARGGTKTIGNFWVDLTRATLYLYLPLSMVVALSFVALGVPQTLLASIDATTLEGAKQVISLGPVASQEAIKLIGTNGGGFFNANSAHPFENPNLLSNMLQVWSMLVVPVALVLAFGRMVGDPRQGRALLYTMGIFFLVGLFVLYHSESAGNQAYLDGELCAVLPDGTTSFSALQGHGDAPAELVYFAFDLLHLDGENLARLPLLERKGRLEALFADAPPVLRFSGHVIGNGARVFEEGSKLGVEGMISKQIDKPYMPGNRGVWVKTKFLNRQEFVVVGWTDPEGSRSSLGSLLLGYYRDDGKLIYAGRAGTGMTESELIGRRSVFRLRKGQARSVRADGREGLRCRHSRPEDRHHDPRQPPQDAASEH